MNKIDELIEEIEKITNGTNKHIENTDNETSDNTYGKKDSGQPTREN